jgi:hypothetical protein
MSLREKILSEIAHIQDESLLKALYDYVQKLSADSPTQPQPKIITKKFQIFAGTITDAEANEVSEIVNTEFSKIEGDW